MADRGARLGVYQDGPFGWVDSPAGRRLAPDPVDAPFLSFVREVAADFDELVLFARVGEPPTTDARLLLPADMRVVELPDYGSLRRIGALAHATLGTAVAFWRGLPKVDVVWTFGPHPLDFVLVVLALLRRKRVVVGLRMETMAYYRARLPSRRWKPVMGVVALLDGAHRLVARVVPATVVGSVNVRRYTTRTGRVLSMMPSLVRAADVLPAAPERDWAGVVELLTVGRIDAEKNPLLLVEAMAALQHSHPGRFRLRWAGVGPMADDVRRRAQELGVGDRVQLLGYVAQGEELLAAYREAHAFVHVSLTEGVPQVLVEAFAAALPVIATDVGDVRAGLDGGRAGLLVPPADLGALTAAIVRLAAEPALRAELSERGLSLARSRTLEAEAARVAAFVAA